MSTFHSLAIKNVVRETQDCVSIYFEIPGDLRETFLFSSGQYLTIKAIINGEEVRRAYSICTAPHETDLGISVKELKGGKMSTFLNNQVKSGDRLEVMNPDGRFVVKTDHLSQRDHYFIAAGSGITPVMSMIKTVLEGEPMSTCYLLYGNKNEDTIIYKSTLEDLQNKYTDQVHVVHTLSQPKLKKKGGLKGMFSKAKPTWLGSTGRINASILKKWMQDYPSKSGNDAYYICGPAGLITTTKDFLLNEDVEEGQINIEYFSTPETEGESSVESIDGALLKATLDGQDYEVTVPKGKNIMDALREAKVDAPFSCTSGACSTCMAKVSEGSAEMDACFALDDDEVADGYILTCQAHPTTEKITISFDV